MILGQGFFLEVLSCTDNERHRARLADGLYIL